MTVGPFQENAYLLVDDRAGRAVLIDPGEDADRLLAELDRSGAALDAIWLTHGHLDHVGAIAAIRRAHPDVPIYLHPEDEPLYRAVEAQAAAYGVAMDPPPPTDHALADGDRLTLGGLAFEVMHAPGHAPGLCVIHGHGVAFVGDLLFAGSIGRTDLPLSDPSRMAASLRRVASLPADTVVYAGHGPATTIGEELAENPFLNGMARVLGG
jgi:hydroxyacylglutathione hydrolase